MENCDANLNGHGKDSRSEINLQINAGLYIEIWNVKLKLGNRAEKD